MSADTLLLFLSCCLNVSIEHPPKSNTLSLRKLRGHVSHQENKSPISQGFCGRERSVRLAVAFVLSPLVHL